MLPRIFPLLLLHSGLSAMDPCWFVGTRILGMMSFCTELDTCSNLVIENGFIVEFSDEVQAPVALPCEEALMVAKQITQFHSAVEHPQKRRRVDSGASALANAIVNAIRDHIIPEVDRLVYESGTLEVRTVDLTDSLRFVHRKMMKLVDSNYDRAQEVIGSQTGIQLMFGLQQLINVAKTSPVSLEYSSPSVTELIHFARDMCSFVNISVCREIIAEDASYWWQHSHPEYRELFPGEAATLDLRPVHDVNTSEGAIAVADAIFELSNRSDANWADDLVSFLGSFNPRSTEPKSVTEELLLAQIRSCVCPKMERIFPKLPRSTTNQKIIISLAHICRGHVSNDILVNTSTVMGLRERRAPGQYILEANDFEGVTNAFISGDIDWMRNFDAIITDKVNFFGQVISRLGCLHDTGRNNRFKTRQELESFNTFEERMRALGRVMALAAFFGVPIGNIVKLPNSFFKSIHYPVPSDAAWKDLDEVSTDILDPLRAHEDLMLYLSQPVFFVKQGFHDVLGPIGMHAFTDTEWVDLFRRTSTRSQRGRSMDIFV